MKKKTNLYILGIVRRSVLVDSVRNEEREQWGRTMGEQWGRTMGEQWWRTLRREQWGRTMGEQWRRTTGEQWGRGKYLGWLDKWIRTINWQKEVMVKEDGDGEFTVGYFSSWHTFEPPR